MLRLKERESTIELRPYISRKVDKIEDLEFELTYYYQFCHGLKLELRSNNLKYNGAIK